MASKISGRRLRRLRLTTLLIGINVGLLLLALSVVALVALSLLQQLSDDQALARVAQAATSARAAIHLAGDEITANAQLLAQRPTLDLLLRTKDQLALTAYLDQFQQTSQLAGSAVIVGDAVFATSGAAMPWKTIWATQRTSSTYFFQATGTGTLMMGAWASVPTVSGSAVITVRLLNDTFTQQLSDEIGLSARILVREAVPAEAPLANLYSQARVAQEPIAARIDARHAYLAIVPLDANAETVPGFIEVELPTTGTAASLRELAQTFLILTALVALAAALISFLFGRWLGHPLSALTGAAARIGRGDLATPLRVSSGGEIGALARTLEEMRQHLLQLMVDLRRQQAESDAIVTNIVEGVFTVDRERHIRYLNPQSANLLGIRAEEAIGRFCGDVLNPQGTDHIRPCEQDCPIIHSRFRAGARATEHLLLATGQRRTVIITSAPPAEVQQVQVLRDETEVEATRRLRDAVLANISHEFRTPLSAQLASIELLLDQLPDLTTEQIAELIWSLQRGTLRLTQLIDNLLESVRLEAGEYTIRRQPVALDEVVEQALELTGPLLQQREQEVVIDLPYPLPPILGDARRLTQVLINLLANANKFSPIGSQIEIGGKVDSKCITLWVQDEGPGMPQIAGQSLFARFVRSPAEEPEQGGVGLGLWIVQSIVERHGGRLDAEAMSKGMRMCVTLPWEPVGENSDR